jgi:hypothetical protein
MNETPILAFNALSGGEQERVLLEITLKIAYYHSMFNSAILLIENTNFHNIDSAGINRLFENIKNDKPNFQFFFTTNENYVFDGFKVHKLFMNENKIIEVC